MFNRTVKVSVAASCITLAAGTTAHPGRGIVVTAEGDVLVSDAVRSVIWKFSPGGEVSALARGVHSHWLSLADDGSVLADHVQYDNATEKFGRGLKRITRDGRIVTLVPEKPDPDGLDSGVFTAIAEGYATVRDSNLHLTHYDTPRSPSAIDLGNVGGKDTVNALIDLPDGTLVGVRGRSVIRIGRGEVPTVVATVPRETAQVKVEPDIEPVWGIAAGERGEVFTTDPSGRRVVRIARDGTITTAATSTSPWIPTGVAVHGTTLYVLEHGLDHDKNLGPRVVVIEPGKSPRILAGINE